MAIYSTNFQLTYPVIDLEAAQEFLTKDDMTYYVHNDSDISADLSDAVENIAWNLLTEESGTIDLETNRELNANELEILSNWVRGQNSDGLGESFEQRDFASYLDEDAYYAELDNYNRYYFYDDEGEEEPSEDDYWHMASFDWKYNHYEFERIE